MAKKIKFALEMADGVQVRTIEELRDNFDQGKAMEYFVNGKLVEWLEDRYYDEEAEAISEIEENAPDAAKKICKALGVEYEDDGNDMEDAINVAEKTAKLKKVTNDEAILKNAAYTAFDQEDLADLLDAGVKTIYLYGDVFSVPVKRISNVKFVGILDSEPKIKLPNSCTNAMLAERKIEFNDGVLLPKSISKKNHFSEDNNSNEIDELKKDIEELAEEILWDQLGKYAFTISGSGGCREVTNPTNAWKKSAAKTASNGKYNYNDMVFLAIERDGSSAIGFSYDSFCVGGALGNNIIKYADIDNVNYNSDGLKFILKNGDEVSIDGTYVEPHTNLLMDNDIYVKFMRMVKVLF